MQSTEQPRPPGELPRSLANVAAVQWEIKGFFYPATYAHQYMAKMHFKLICVFVAKYHNGFQLYSRRAHSLKFYC